MSRLVSFLLITLGILVTAGVVIAIFSWMAVPSMLSSELSNKMQVRVKIDDVTLSYRKIGVNGVYIGNVPNSILPTAFSSKTIKVEAPVTTYLNQDIVIDDILVDDIYLGLEFDSPSGTSGNWTKIMQNAQNSQTTSAQKTENKQRTVLIKKIVLTNINVDVVYKTAPSKIKHLPTIDRIELTNISSEGGFPTDQIMNSVLGEMLKSVFIQQNMKDMLEGLLDTPGNTYDKYLSPFKGLFNANETPSDPNAA